MLTLHKAMNTPLYLPLIGETHAFIDLKTIVLKVLVRQESMQLLNQAQTGR